MKKIILSAVICGIFSLVFSVTSVVICVSAEEDETEFKIQELSTAKLSGNLSLNFPWLLGLNSEVKEPSVYEVFTGKELYTAGNSLSAGLNFLPSFDTGKLLLSLFDLDSDAKVTDKLKDNLAAGVTAKAPELTLPVGIKSGLTSLTFSTPYRNFFFGATYRQLFSLNCEMLASGIDTAFHIKQSTDPAKMTDVTARIKPTINLATNIQVNQYRLRVGALLPNNLTGEVNFNYYQTEINIDGPVFVDSLLFITKLNGGDKNELHQFNTEKINDLSQSLNAKYKGSGQNLGFALGYHFFAGRLGVNATYNLPTKIKLEGENTIITHTPLLLRLFLPEDSELLPEGDFDPSYPTKTEEKTEFSNEPVSIEFPSSAGLDFIWRTKILRLSLGYTHYLAPLKYEYENEKDDFNLTGAVRLDFSTRFANLIAGVILTEEIPLPIFSLGFGIPISRHWQTDVVVFAVPLQLLRTTISYRF